MDYFISDTHFSDSFVLDRNHRPFSSVAAMNETLVDNWNAVVDETDVVYHLGDFTHAPGHGKSEEVYSIDHWDSVLRGKLCIIRGNHDHPDDTKGLPSFESAVYSDGYIDNPLYLEHEPVGFDGWQLHGHSHDNDLHMYPFFNPERKTINVSVEVVGYEPVPADEIIQLVKRGYKRAPTRGDVTFK